METTNCEVHIKPAKPSIAVVSKNIETNTLAVFVLRSHVQILQDLMLCIAPHVTYHKLRFIPANLLYGKLICDGKQNYTNLLKEQTQYLANYKDFRIGSISKAMSSKEFDGKMF
eukprot:4045893-Ditylum_brightwellii.AAC.1